eukprot:832532-Prorocentrum_minimum.AAC.1
MCVNSPPGCVNSLLMCKPAPAPAPAPGARAPANNRGESRTLGGGICASPPRAIGSRRRNTPPPVTRLALSSEEYAPPSLVRLALVGG